MADRVTRSSSRYPTGLTRSVPLAGRRDREDTRRTAWRVCGLTVAFLILGAWSWHRHGPSALDRVILRGYTVSKASTIFDAANTVTVLGSPSVVVVLSVAAAALVFMRYRSLPWAVACVLGPAIAGVAETTLKVVVARPRPSTAALVGESGNGFPSGHAAGFAAFAFVIAFALSRLCVRSSRSAVAVALIASGIMAATRVLVGAHYPSDAIAGVVIGIVTAEVVALGARRASNPLIR